MIKIAKRVMNVTDQIMQLARLRNNTHKTMKCYVKSIICIFEYRGISHDTI